MVGFRTKTQSRTSSECLSSSSVLGPRSVLIHHRSSSSASESSSSSDSEGTSFRPLVKKAKKAPSKPRKNATPYDQPTTPPSRPPPREFVEFFTQDEGGTKSALGENEYLVHSIDWDNAPLIWGRVRIPCMPADEVIPWLAKKHHVSKAGCPGKCLLKYCPDLSREKGTGLKNHLLSAAHLNLRRKCHTCRFACRPDMFDARHNCRSQKAKNAEIIRNSPGLPMASYTWPPSKAI